jgi:hypothetical protein
MKQPYLWMTPVQHPAGTTLEVPIKFDIFGRPVFLDKTEVLAIRKARKSKNDK